MSQYQSGLAKDATLTAAVGAQADAEATGNGSSIGVLKRLRTLLSGGLPAAPGAGGGLKIDGSGTSLPTTAAQGTAGAVGNAWPVKNTDGTNTAAVKAASTAAATADPALVVGLSPNSPMPAGTNAIGNLNEIRAATSYVTNTGASAAAVTLTLSAAGAGLFHYITSIEITAYAAAARTGSATPWLVTTTNITGSPVYTFSTAAAIGTTDIQRVILSTPLKVTTANTNTTFVAPAATGVIWRIQVTYFTAV